LGDRFVEAAGRRSRSGDAGDTRAAVGVPFKWKTVGAPVGLAGGVVVDAGKAEAVEPRRGSWAHVSLIVVAVDDHRPRRIELPRSVGVEQLQRNIDRAREVLVRVLVRG